MRYSPTNYNVRPLMISIFLTVVGITAVYAASYLVKYKWLMQLLFICFLTAAIQILLKYVLTKLEYVCKDGELLIYKSLGRKSVMVASIPLNYSESRFLTKTEFQESADTLIYSETYVYTRNLGADPVYFYVTSVTPKGALIKIECTKEYAEILNSEIDTAMKGKCEDDEI